MCKLQIYLGVPQLSSERMQISFNTIEGTLQS
jgi:hypothetical protein